MEQLLAQGPIPLITVKRAFYLVLSLMPRFKWRQVTLRPFSTGRNRSKISKDQVPFMLTILKGLDEAKANVFSQFGIKAIADFPTSNADVCKMSPATIVKFLIRAALASSPNIPQLE